MAREYSLAIFYVLAQGCPRGEQPAAGGDSGTTGWSSWGGTAPRPPMMKAWKRTTFPRKTMVGHQAIGRSRPCLPADRPRHRPDLLDWRSRLGARLPVAW